MPLKGREAPALQRLTDKKKRASYISKATQTMQRTCHSNPICLLCCRNLSLNHRLEGNVQDVGFITFCNKTITNSTWGCGKRMPTIKPAVMQRHLQSLSECSACLWKDTSVCRGLFQPNNQPIHPNDCSIQDKLTHPSHNRTLQMTLFNQGNRFVLFLKTNESHFGCRGLSCVLLSANKSTGIAEET